jgi:hypothetical protein
MNREEVRIHYCSCGKKRREVIGALWREAEEILLKNWAMSKADEFLTGKGWSAINTKGRIMAAQVLLFEQGKSAPGPFTRSVLFF